VLRYFICNLKLTLGGKTVTHFDDLFWLVAVVDAGTLRGAAEKHGVSGAAVSKRIKQLEDRLSVRLLERNSRRLRTTEAGEAYYQRGKRLLEAFAELEESVASSNETLSGTIRVNAPHSFGLLRLGQPIAGFMAEHPDVRVQIDLDDSFIDINESDYDVVVRIGKLEDSSVISQRVSTVELICCASPDYLARRGEPKIFKELANHNCLIYDQNTAFTDWQATKDGGIQQVHVEGSVRSNNGQLLCQLAQLGHGIVIQPQFIAEAALESGELVTILNDYAFEQVGVYALYPSRSYLPTKIKRFIRYLKQELS